MPIVLHGGREEWEAARDAHVGVTASAVSAIVPGYEYIWRGKPNPTAYDMWLRYTKRAKSRISNIYIRGGEVFEEPNIIHFSRECGVECHRTAYTTATNEDYPLLLASPDAFMIWPSSTSESFQAAVRVTDPPPPGEKCLLESKNVSASQKRAWTSETPLPAYYAQVQAQLLAMKMQHAVLMAKLDSCKLFAYHIEANAAFQMYMYDCITAFQRVVDADVWDDSWFENL